jgi:hypothetical protein
MEHDVQYLCIVANRSGDKTTSGQFLPFEGDCTLSIMLSKAITDTTINSHIGHALGQPS